jgi:protocatechuate 3,4-dioxygenase beta subunit
MKNWMPFIKVLVALSCCLFLISCSSDSSSSGTVAPPTERTPTQLALGVSNPSVKSDNSDSVTITASVLDDDNVAVEGATVNFKATGGILSAGSVITEADGTATVDFSSGLVDKSNSEVVISAEVTGISTEAQIPIQITGTTIDAMSTIRTLLSADSSNPDTLRVKVTDSGGNPIFNANVSLTVSTASTGSVAISPSSGLTDVLGEFEATIAGTNAGTATITISAKGALASQSYTVQPAGGTFAIISPTVDPVSALTGGSQPIVVSNPTPGASNEVVFSTTLGTLTSGVNTDNSISVLVANGQAQASLTSNFAGIATVQVYDADNPSVTDSIKVVFSAPADQADKVTIQASNTVVSPSTTTLTNSVTLTARVLTDGDQPVGNAPVLFSLSNTSGGGESIFPTVAFTNSFGTATATFTSGSLSSNASGVNVTASLLANDTINDTISIIIGGTAGSVVLGRSFKQSSIRNDTAYSLPISVLVTDANGNPVPGAEVTLGIWPTFYWAGEFETELVPDPDDPGGPLIELPVVDPETGNNVLKWYSNEDKNRNLFLDTTPFLEDKNLDGELTPPLASAGEVPITVIADEFGAATFDMEFLKIYATYVHVALTASTMVNGSETTSTSNFTLPVLIADLEFLPPSPFNPQVLP